jgi:LysM repeat protein
MFVDKTASLSRKIGKVVGQGERGGSLSPNQLNNINMEKEETSKPISLKNALVVVVSLHAVALFGLIYFSSVKSSQAESDKIFLTEDKYVGIEPSPTPTPTLTPTPTPVPMDKMPEKESWPTTGVKQELKTYPNTKKAIPVKQNNSHLTKEYVVKKGDTFNGIVRKYKLNADKLKQLNNIKNENTIRVGQKLKLM